MARYAQVRTIHVRMTPTTRPTWPSRARRRGVRPRSRGRGDLEQQPSRRAWREGAFAGPALPGLLDQRDQVARTTEPAAVMTWCWVLWVLGRTRCPRGIPR